jgi:hypothetical protein
MRAGMTCCALVLALCAHPAGATAQTAAADSAGIRAAAMDYIEGWYAGDAQRMARALHPELAKRIVFTDSTGHSRLGQMSAMTLVDYTGAGGGKQTPAEKQRKEFRILDVYHGAAVAKIVASEWVDYLELGKWNGQWKIVNVLWERTPPPEQAMR